MNTQEAYQRIRAYFSRPGAVLAKVETDVFSDSACQYRTASGDKCAVGCLIPDKLYNEQMEGQGIIVLHNTMPGDVWYPVKEYFRNIDKGFLRAAQTAHDSVAETPEHFIELLDRLAVDYGLQI